jgi:hypothetical protein
LYGYNREKGVGREQNDCAGAAICKLDRERERVSFSRKKMEVAAKSPLWLRRGWH